MTEIRTNADLIALCFRSEKLPNSEKFNSILYLLRREIKNCFGLNPENDQPNGFYAKWPGTMAIMAGIDLLAKYDAGTLDEQGVGVRFKSFLGKYWGLDSTNQEIIWQLRNSLCHSFALFSKDWNGKEYKFELSESAPNLIVHSGNDNYQIGLDKLLEHFFTGISNYEMIVNTNDQHKDNLVSVFSKIGLITTR